MPQDFYGEGDEGASTATAEHDESVPHDDKDGMEDKDEGETALIPKALLAGKDFKPGEEVVFKVVHLFEDEVEISYSNGKEKPEEKPKSQMEQSGDALEKLGKPATGGC